MNMIRCKLVNIPHDQYSNLLAGPNLRRFLLSSFDCCIVIYKLICKLLLSRNGNFEGKSTFANAKSTVRMGWGGGYKNGPLMFLIFKLANKAVRFTPNILVLKLFYGHRINRALQVSKFDILRPITLPENRKKIITVTEGIPPIQEVS